MTITDAIGWIGTALILAAFLQTSSTRWSPTGAPAAVANFLGAIALAITAGAREAWSIVALNSIWALIALVTLIKLRKKN